MVTSIYDSLIASSNSQIAKYEKAKTESQSQSSVFQNNPFLSSLLGEDSNDVWDNFLNSLILRNNYGASAQPLYSKTYCKASNYDQYNKSMPTSIALKKASEEIGQTNGYQYGESGRWCAAFASWVYGGKNAPWGDEHSVAAIKDWAVQNNVYKYGKTPDGVKPGDLVVWRPETCDGSSHVGIVANIASDGTVTTIEGNSYGVVRKKSYPPGHTFDGYVKVNDYKQRESKSISKVA